MKEISITEANEIHGGVIPLIIGVVATDAFAIGFTAGAINGYATVSSLWKMR